MYRELKQKADLLNNREEAAGWLEQCDDRLLTLSNEVKDPKVSIKRSAITRIIDLKSLRARVVRRFMEEKRGGNYVENGNIRESNSSDEEVGKDIFWIDLEAAFENRLITGMVVNSTHVDPREFLEDSFPLIAKRVVEAIKEHRMVKANAEFRSEFMKHDGESDIKSFNTKNAQLDVSSSLDEWYSDQVIAPILRKMEDFQERDSGWTLSRIDNIAININRYEPLSGGCCIDIPEYIKAKHAVIDVKSSDRACFAWSVVACLYPPRDKSKPSRVSNYPHYAGVLNVKNISFPTTLKEIRQFEEDNDLSINVFTYDESAEWKRRIVPLRLAPKLHMDRHINLLYISDEHHGHYVYVKNLSRLLSMEISKHKQAKYICQRCLNYFHEAKALQKHEEYCINVNDTRVVLPSSRDEAWTSFKNYKNKEPVPMVVYADLECLLVSGRDDHHSCSDDEEAECHRCSVEAEDYDKNVGDKIVRKKTRIYQQHEPYSVGYYVKNTANPEKSHYTSHRGSDCLEWFAQNLRLLTEEIAHTVSTVQPMPEMTASQTSRHFGEINCHICQIPFSPNDKRVRDHCHITGKHRGPAHNSCNLMYRIDRVIPVILHNLSGYDGHFIIRAIAKAFEGRMTVLPINKERYISFSKINNECKVELRFIDSYKFLSASLNKLSSYLLKDELTIFQSEFTDLTEEQVTLLMRKGIFPYDYVDSFHKLDNDTRLPDKKYFYNRLNDCDVSDDDYDFARQVWNMFDLKTLGEYSDLYLKTDVLLLADIFENFRKRCMYTYELDPAHYYTLPGFTWDAMLKYTKVRFELLTDIDMLMMIEKGIRGGLCQCSCRYAQANNRYVEPYDENEPSTYLMYFDVNNLYGWAMCQCLPTHGFQWANDISESVVLNTADDSPIGYILEVDLLYPKNLHDTHADLPFCPTHDKPVGSKQCKLIASLRDKKNYVIHYRALKQCVKHGLLLARIHRCISFSQSSWLQPYIDLNTQLRTKATNEFEKNLFKLMNNAVFGKTMENVRKRVDVKLVSRWKGRCGAKKLIALPNFHSRTVFDENFCAIQLKRQWIKFDKPMYIGMSILDISKTHLYDFHYGYVKMRFDGKHKLLYTDTDSLIYSLRCSDVYEEMKNDLSFFDTSDYPEQNAYGIPKVNKKVPGLMKDENCGRIMQEFVGLRAKMYAMRTEGCCDVKKCKGVKRCVVERKINFEDYVRCLQNGDTIVQNQNLLRSYRHNVFSMQQSKVALNSNDDKRYLVPNSYDTLPWGHYRIEDFERSTKTVDITS